MKPYYADDSVTLYHGDCLDVLRLLPDSSIDAVCTDPPYGLGFMGKAWDDLPPGLPWAQECLRVLKPGGHLLAFGGTRTWHRLAVAVEDAGFEVRDSIAWLYGSGFPKSLDVSKAIDKAAGVTREVVGPSPFAARGSSLTGPRSRAGQAEVGYRPDGDPYPGEAGRGDITAPATPAAQQWQGWGTALKPAFEPIVVARKPLVGSVSVRPIVEASLRAAGVEGEIRWASASASGAEQLDPPISSSSTAARAAEGTSAGRAGVSETPNAARLTESGSGPSIEHGPQPTASTSEPSGASTTPNCETPSSRPTGRAVPAAASPSASSSPSTTSTAGGRRTASRSTARSTPSSAGSASLPVTESFAGTATGLTGSLAHVRIDRLTDGSFVWPDGLPEVVAGGSTVAANVLAHGTGALNVDGCRVGAGPRPADDIPRGRRPRGMGETGERNGDPIPNGPTYAAGEGGRWPANVLLDGDAAAELDGQSGTLKSGDVAGSKRSTTGGNGITHGAMPGAVGESYADSGGASRFFPTFRYQAKAPTRERPTVVAEDGTKTAHPTVKPLALMRWLVRLVTPPGGTVLDTFAGSGATVEAAILEGFQVIGIEREADYLPLIEARIARNQSTGKRLPSAAEALALFDFEEPA